jgi:hypothetical protein
MGNMRQRIAIFSLGIVLALPLANTSFAQNDTDWTEPFPPFRIAGNLYYVGSKGLANYLVTTPQGNILINSTGPGECGERCDGWFASLLRDPHHARYVILVFIQGRGLGGGLAARTAASTAQFLAAQEKSSATKSPH